MTERLQRLHQKLKDENLDSLLISSPANIRYLTGYEARESYLLVSLKQVVFITDSRYSLEAQKHLPGLTVRVIEGAHFAFIAAILKEYGCQKVGFEAKNLVYGEKVKIEEELNKNIALIPTYDLADTLRIIKDKQELEKIARATKIAIQVFKFAQKILKPGLKEIEVYQILEQCIRVKYGCKASFEIIVASGPNSSFPHHLTSNRKLKKNEPVLIDLGVDFEGYKSDLTRVFFLGNISAYAKRVKDIVLCAQKSAIDAIKPGVPAREIDARARNYISQNGFGANFGHSLGHGIGLEVHEDPHISSRGDDTLEAGMVFTVEPAIYLADAFGIRIEDMVMVTEKGCEVLSGSLNK